MNSKIEKLLGKNFSHTPTSVGEKVLEFCKTISPNYTPYYVDVIPDPEAVPSECYFNVKNRIDKIGGEILYGWCIREWPTLYIEAEHHAVWKSQDEILDPSPSIQGDSQSLFLPDPENRFDFEAPRWIKMHHFPLMKDRDVSRFIDLIEARFEEIEGQGTSDTYIQTPKIREIEFEHALTQLKLILKHARNVGRNGKCICGSGKKLKNCCNASVKEIRDRLARPM